MKTKPDPSLYQLHQLYNKHEKVVIAKAVWTKGNPPEAIYGCTCGCKFWCLDTPRNSPVPEVMPYNRAMCDEWIKSTMNAMEKPWQERFIKYLKRIGWRAEKREVSVEVFGPEGAQRPLLKGSRHEQ